MVNNSVFSRKIPSFTVHISSDTDETFAAIDLFQKPQTGLQVVLYPHNFLPKKNLITDFGKMPHSYTC